MSTEKLKSIDEVARLAGVAKSTVSRALNDSPLISAETKARILAIAAEHHFKPSSVARNLSLQSTRTIAFVNCAYCGTDCCISDQFSLEIMGGLAIGLHDLGYDLLVLHIDPADTDWASQYLDSGKVDGFILMTAHNKRHHIDRLVQMGAPFIIWGPAEGEFCTVAGEDRKGGRMATERLLTLNRSHVGFLGGPRVEAEVQLRHKGYIDALEAANIGFDPRLVYYGDYSARIAARAVEVLLEREPRLDALFAGSDVMAISAMRALAAHGRRVPEDVAVVGYDDLSLASYATPALTTVSQNVNLAGRLLGRDLVSYLERGVVTHSIVPVHLIGRESA